MITVQSSVVPFVCANNLRDLCRIISTLNDKDIAPLIFESSWRKKWKVQQAMQDNAWVTSIKMDHSFTMDHLSQYVVLWSLLQNVSLTSNVEDEIEWKLTENGQYSAASAYEVQFLGMVLSNLEKTLWKAWAPPKTKFFAWLATQNRLWTADRLEKRGRPNCGLCPLCKQSAESVNHLFVHCRYTRRLCDYIKDWLGLHSLHPTQWDGLSIKSWWSLMTEGPTQNRKAAASLTLLTSWEIWNERNDRVFRNKHAPPFVVLDKIKKEARLWVLAGAKRLGEIMPGE